MSRSVLLAGGGSAGHVNPLLATADALLRIEPATRVTVLGTAEGLEQRLVPARGYRLLEVPRVPLPRRLSAELLGVPGRLVAAVAVTSRHLADQQVDVVVGFGGYVSLPAYLAARRRRLPIVVHEANPRPGLANRVGARLTRQVAVATAGTPLPHAQVLGIPLRREVAGLDRAAQRDRARAELGLGPGPVLLVTGGSQGARSINSAVATAAARLAAAGIQVLQVTGPRNFDEVKEQLGADLPSSHHLLAYLDRVELGYAAADLVLCRAGALTCAELTAVGLPAVYVPLPIGNGEQALNAERVVAGGGGLFVKDGELTGGWLERQLPALLADEQRLAAMASAAARLGHRDADEALARLVLAAPA